MKGFFLFFCLIILFSSGCSKQEKGCTSVKPEIEEPRILAFAADSLDVTRHNSGIYYQIIDPGTGATATLSSAIRVRYVGKLLDGSTFDRGTNETAGQNAWALTRLIEGWQIGIPLIKQGGRIKLIIPSAYGYGCNPSGSIPGNSVLYFDITLVSVE